VQIKDDKAYNSYRTIGPCVNTGKSEWSEKEQRNEKEIRYIVASKPHIGCQLSGV